MASLKRYWIYGMPAIVTIVGVGLNRLVITANQGMMPVAWLADKEFVTKYYKFGHLADILPGYTSIGDWLIWTGLMIYLFMLIFQLLKDRITEYEEI